MADIIHSIDSKNHSQILHLRSIGGILEIRKYNKESNNIPKVCLNFRTPNEVLNDYLSVM